VWLFSFSLINKPRTRVIRELAKQNLSSDNSVGFLALMPKWDAKSKNALLAEQRNQVDTTSLLKASELPKGPWQFVEMDFQGPYPNGGIHIWDDR
jgi:hypothetical protein